MINQNSLFSVNETQQNSQQNSFCTEKPVIYIQENAIEYRYECPVLYLKDANYNGLIAITYSSDLETTVSLLSNFNTIELFITLPEDYIEVSQVSEDANLTLKLTELNKNFFVYKVANTHLKAYFLYNHEDEDKRRLILGSANLSSKAWKTSQVESFIVIDNPFIYESYYNYVKDNIIKNAVKVIDYKKVEKEFKENNIKTKIKLVPVPEIVYVEKNQTQTPKTVEVIQVEEKEKALQVIEENILKNFVQLERINEKTFSKHIVDVIKESLIINKKEEELKKRKDIIKSFTEAVKNPSKEKEIIKSIVQKETQQEMDLETFKRFNYPYTFDYENKVFIHRGLENLFYDKDILQRDVEILNKFIKVYSSPNGEYNEERYITISFVLLFAFASYYGFLIRHRIKDKDSALFEIAPNFCLLVGQANCGKTLLLTLISKLTGVKVERYGDVVGKRNRGNILTMYYDLETITPFLIDEIKASDLEDKNDFGSKIKYLSNNPFFKGEFAVHGHTFLTANIDDLKVDMQIVRRTFFIHFKNSIKNSQEFKVEIQKTGFNDLTDNIAKYYVNWLNENKTFVQEFILSFSDKYSSKDFLWLAYKFLQSLGVELSFDFPEDFGKYSYFSRKSWKHLWIHHNPNNSTTDDKIFIDAGDKIKVKRDQISKYLIPEGFFNIEEAKTEHYYVFDKDRFLIYIGEKENPYKEEKDKKGFMHLLKKIFIK